MIRRIQIDNFKSLDRFSLPPAGTPPLANFTCLIGANGSGKTTVLQVLDFLCYFMRGDVRGWLQDRGWEGDRLSSSFDGSPLDQFDTSISIQIDSSIHAKWKVHYNLYTGESDEECIEIDDHPVLIAKDGNIRMNSDHGESRVFDGVSIPGSALSILANPPSPLPSIKEQFSTNIVTFELFSPRFVKKHSPSSKSMGRRGENLAGFAAFLGPNIQRRISEQMRKFYPDIQDVHVADDFELKEHRLVEAEKILREVVPSLQFSDGFIRILAIVTQVESSTDSNRVLLIDEIEDGIHPELMEKLIDYLTASNVQVIATTHSPIILNYLTDEQAKDSMIFLYRDKDWRTRACRYFDLPSAQKRLGLLGPGEVYVDIPVDQLAREAEELFGQASHATTEDRR